MNGMPLTWGDSSYAYKATEQLDLKTHLAGVPEGGTFVDVGSGAGCGLGAVAYLARPDIEIISVDPGFGLPETDEEELVAGRELMLRCGGFDEDELARLQETDAWYAERRTGCAEDLPLDSESVDLMASYAAVPEYSDNTDGVLYECLRTLKAGGLAVHGPIHDSTLDYWQRLIEKEAENGAVSIYRSNLQTIEVGMNSLDVNFTLLTKK